MAKDAPELLVHKEWLGQIQQVGLVVSPFVLVRRGVGIDKQKALDIQRRIESIATFDEHDDPQITDLATFAHEILEWPLDVLTQPDASLSVTLPEHEDLLTPTFAIPGAESKPVLLVIVTEAGLDSLPEHHKGWRATPHARLERLLRETEIPIGLLFNGRALRLVYAPRGESSGHLTFRLKDLLHTQGRPMAGALDALLGADHFTGVHPDERRLPALLKESRKFQNEVSTKLAGQVLEALWELLRGFQRANEEASGRLLADVLREDSNDVYGGLLSTLMRLVFILYAEDRGLMPQGEVYQNHYSLLGLFKRLQDDDANHPDTMDARFGAWAQMLALFRLVHDGGGHGDLRFPARHGRLFDPDSYPFLEGRPAGSSRNTTEVVHPPKVSDGAVFRILRNLLILDGQRLSYRTLDVEQIGSVYEAMMGFALRQATGPSIAVLPKHVVFDIGELLEQDAKKRAEWLKNETEAKLTGDAIAKAKTVEDVVAALAKRVSLHTPHVLKAGDIYLQPTGERRRSGSHYTPRSLTAPIVATTFRPIFERLGDHATPEEILDLKVCDPAMGSGAFLVEACRLLGDRLVRAWETHRQAPKVPDDEDVVTYARRLVAARCLYGVDKNIFAVDLAKLSLWLATLAREHPFTFLDHSVRHGDSLVGLSREQIACFNWQKDRQLPLVRGLIDERVKRAQRIREQIQNMATSDDIPAKSRLLKESNEALEDVRRIGDQALSAFFERDKPKDRESLRRIYASQIQDSLNKSDPVAIGQSRPEDLVTFHWEMEFPEVFARTNAGFDAFVGNPPFMGGGKISTNLGSSYLDWVLELNAGSHGNGDLVAHFFRRTFDFLRAGGAFGLIATNTISQGDTRSTGLTRIRNAGGIIFEARKRLKWPSGAAVVVSVVHVVKKALEPPFLLDGRPVNLITAFLFSAGSDDVPEPLVANSDRAFLGNKIYGQGFTFDDTDKTGATNPIELMNDLVKRSARNAERIYPYIGGEEVNDSPTHSHHRYVINFGQMSEQEAWQWPDLMAIAEEKVKPERMLLADNPDGRRRKKYWWQWGRYTPALFQAIQGLERVLVISAHTECAGLAFLSPVAVYSHALVVIALQSYSAFAALQCRLHEIWARFFGSSIGMTLRYTPGDCFEAYPFPSGWESHGTLENAGQEYYRFRSELMVGRNEGLTTIYNRFHDPGEHNPEIEKLRVLHATMDRAVLDAYGWTDLQPTCEFILDYEAEEGDEAGKASKKKKPWRYRWPDETRDEVLGRLLELNSDRAKAQIDPVCHRGQPGGKSKEGR